MYLSSIKGYFQNGGHFEPEVSLSLHLWPFMGKPGLWFFPLTGNQFPFPVENFPFPVTISRRVSRSPLSLETFPITINGNHDKREIFPLAGAGNFPDGCIEREIFPLAGTGNFPVGWRGKFSLLHGAGNFPDGWSGKWFRNLTEGMFVNSRSRMRWQLENLAANC